MKIHYKIQGIAAALSLCIASNFAQGQTIVTGWDKAGDTDGWALPAEQYLKDFPMVKSASQSGDVVNNGNGSLKLAVEISTDEKARRGRVDKFYGGKADWKRFTSFSIMCHVPAGAPQVQASIAVMSGAWKWTECKPVTCKAGEWTKVSIDTADITNPEEIQLVMFIPWVHSGEFKGDLYIDKAMLEGEKIVGPSKPGVDPTSPSSTWLETFDSIEEKNWDRQGARVVVLSWRTGIGAPARRSTHPAHWYRRSPRTPHSEPRAPHPRQPPSERRQPRSGARTTRQAPQQHSVSFS